MLLDPRNAHYNCRLAECFYSTGVESQLLAARKHYTISLTHQAAGFNTRALYGLLVTCQALQSTSTMNEHEKKVNEELLRWSKDQVEALVNSQTSNSILPLVASAIV